MFKQTTLISWTPGADPDACRSLRDRAHAAVATAELSQFTEAVRASRRGRGGDVVWHLHFSNRASWEASAANGALDMLADDPLTTDVDMVAYEARRRGTGQHGLRNGIYRALFIKVSADAAAAHVRQLEDDLAGMPEHIPEILNWGINPIVASRGGDAPWTHIWEQEFAEIGHLTEAYMMSAYHWAYVDRWFDREIPQRIADDGLVRHSASGFTESIMAHY